MVTPQGIILVIFGGFICFAGYSLFKTMLPLWGFFLGGLVFMTFAPGLFPTVHVSVLVIQIVAFIVGGAIGALISQPLYYVILFLTGAAMGGLIGMVLGAYLQLAGGIVSFRALTELSNMPFPPPVTSTLQTGLIIILAIVSGGAAIGFQRFMVSASTAFIGSAALIAGLDQSVMITLRSRPGSAVWILLGWLVLAIVGLFLQYRMGEL